MRPAPRLSVSTLFTSVVLLAALGTNSCTRSTPVSQFPALEDEFVNKSLSFSPVGASGQGLHKFGGHDFDRELDDLTNSGIQNQRQF